jgi:hypothetical protein
MKSEEYEINEIASEDDVSIAETIIANMLVKQWLTQNEGLSEPP